jgi:hypothetical protein
MACSGNDQTLGALNSPQRNNYFYGKLMDVPHFEMEQSYGNRKRWLLNRLGLGYGVLCGLQLSIKDKQVCISPGVAIDAYGREIMVPQAVCVDPWTLTDDCGCAKVTPLSNTEAHDKILLCLAYKECRTDFMPVLVTDCNIKQDCLPGTVVESYCILVQDASTGNVLPENFPPTIDPALCAELGSGASEEDKRQKVCELNPAVTCGMPSGPICVVLGTVSLKADGTIDNTKVDQCSLRTNLVSNEHLLDMLLCTGGTGGGAVTAPSLTNIKAISWIHDQTIRIQDFPTSLTVTFSDDVSTTATNPRAWFMVTFEFPGGGAAVSIGLRATPGLTGISANPPLFSLGVLNGTVALTTPTAVFTPTADFLTAVQGLTDPDPTTNNVQTLPLLCRVTVLCDFLLDKKNSKAVDGDFLGGVLPTGNGVPGGAFESWFSVTMQIDLGPKD